MCLHFFHTDDVEHPFLCHAASKLFDSSEWRCFPKLDLHTRWFRPLCLVWMHVRHGFTCRFLSSLDPSFVLRTRMDGVPRPLFRESVGFVCRLQLATRGLSCISNGMEECRSDLLARFRLVPFVP